MLSYLIHYFGSSRCILMNGIYYYLIAFAVIWILSAVFHDRLEKHGFEINFPVIMWKTQRLRGLISRISNFSPTFWRWYMNVGIVVAFGAMIGWGWVVSSGQWIQQGGVLGTVIGFIIGGSRWVWMPGICSNFLLCRQKYD